MFVGQRERVAELPVPDDLFDEHPSGRLGTLDVAFLDLDPFEFVRPEPAVLAVRIAPARVRDQDLAVPLGVHDRVRGGQLQRVGVDLECGGEGSVLLVALVLEPAPAAEGVVAAAESLNRQTPGSARRFDPVAALEAPSSTVSVQV